MTGGILFTRSLFTSQHQVTTICLLHFQHSRVALRKRADSIAMNIFVSALCLPSRGGSRRRAFWRHRLDKRRATLAGAAPLLVIAYTEKAERLM